MARGDVLFRQWELIRVLQAHQFGISTEDLAERLECDKRTVQRDLSVMQDIFPIHYEQRDRGKRFWKLDNDSVLSDQLQLTVTELLSLYFSQKLALPLMGTQLGDGYQTAIRKIKSTLPKRALAFFEGLEEAFLIRHAAYVDYAAHDQTIRILNEAIHEQHAVSLRYRTASGSEMKASTFAPYGMMLHQYALYCVGYLESADDIRTLKVVRIQSAAPLQQTFTKPEGFSLSAHFAGAFGVIQEEKPIQVEVEFSGWAALNVRETQWHPSQTIIKDQKDSVTAAFEITSTHEFKRLILGYGRHARVLKPATFAEELQDEAREMYDR